MNLCLKRGSPLLNGLDILADFADRVFQLLQRLFVLLLLLLSFLQVEQLIHQLLG